MPRFWFSYTYPVSRDNVGTAGEFFQVGSVQALCYPRRSATSGAGDSSNSPLPTTVEWFPQFTWSVTWNPFFRYIPKQVVWSWSIGGPKREMTRTWRSTVVPTLATNTFMSSPTSYLRNATGTGGLRGDPTTWRKVDKALYLLAWVSHPVLKRDFWQIRQWSSQIFLFSIVPFAQFESLTLFAAILVGKTG